MTNGLRIWIVAAVLPFGVLISASSAAAAEVKAAMYLSTPTGPGAPVGFVTARDTEKGLELMPNLSGLPEGAHGFHVHQKADCGPGVKDGKAAAGLAAGGHFDPANTGRHEGPTGSGHLGDLPVLLVNKMGEAKSPIYAPRLKTSDIRGLALMIHSGGDNYSDTPRSLGGGGARIACGIIY